MKKMFTLGFVVLVGTCFVVNASRVKKKKRLIGVVYDSEVEPVPDSTKNQKFLKFTNPSPVIPLIDAIKRNNLVDVILRVEGNAPVNVEYEGKTPLGFAASKGNLEIVKFLVQKGANVNQQTRDGRTPIVHAAEGDHISVVQHLIMQGADIEDAKLFPSRSSKEHMGSKRAKRKKGKERADTSNK